MYYKIAYKRFIFIVSFLMSCHTIRHVRLKSFFIIKNVSALFAFFEL